MESEQTGLTTEQVLGVMRRRVPVILLCFVVVAGVAFGLSKQQTKKYTATASLVFSNSQLSQQVAGLPVANGNNQQAQQNTNVKLIELGDMAEKTASILGRGLTKDDIKEDLSATAQGESNIVDVAVAANSPSLAAEIANTYTNQFVNEQQHSNSRAFNSALRIVHRQLAALPPKERATTQGLALQERAQSLEIFALLQSGTVQVAQPATAPTSPSSPKTLRNTALGAVLGLMLGLGIAFLLERFDRRIRKPQDLGSIYGLPLLGVVPESGAYSRTAGRSGAVRGSLPPGDAEAFHLIRAHLRYFNVDKELRTLMVVSAAPGDGKTTVARHLATAAASVGSKVLLLEADLRRPTLARLLDIAAGPGVSDVLIGAASLSDASQTVILDPESGDRGRALCVLTAGATLPPNPGELIESHAMETLLAKARAEYDLIVIDTPPLTAVSDAFPLLGKVDGVIIVGRVGRNRRDVAHRLHETLAGAGAPLLGVIANGVNARGPGSYAYAYTYEYTKSTPDNRADKPGSDQSPESSASLNGVPSVGGTDTKSSSDKDKSVSTKT